jgi:uncharacterized membrane protein
MLHLFHPAFVHFSVAFILAGGGAEVWGLATGRETARRWGAVLVLVALGSLVPTLASGYLAGNTVEIADGARPLLEAHERNAWILLALLFGTQFWKAWRGGRLGDAERWLYVVVMTAIVLLTAYGAWLGGRMVYGYGVGVL